jgi:K+/H+ antiporter YhaU regulatory subunit KhtT
VTGADELRRAVALRDELANVIATALADADTSAYRWPQQEDIRPIAVAATMIARRYADAQVAAERAATIAAIRTEAARYTAPDPEERAYRDGLRLAASIIARGQL